MARCIRLAFLTLVLGSAMAVAQTNKLNGPLPRELRPGWVQHYLASPDGTRIVYRADKRAAGTFELFSVPADGSALSIRLNDPLPPGGGVQPDFQGRAFAFGSDGRVVYRADQTTDGVHELWVVPSDGSASPVRITPAGLDVVGFWLTAANEVLYRGSGLDLFRVPLAGGPAEGIAFNRLVDRVWTSPDAATTVFSAINFGSGRQLFRVPTDGSQQPVLLDVSASPNHKEESVFFDALSFAPDGVHLLYQEVMLISDGDEGEDRFDLRSATLDGSHPPVTLNQTDPWFRGGYAFDPSSASGRLAFLEAGALVSVAFDGTGHLTLAQIGQDRELPLVVHGPDVYFHKDLAGIQSIGRVTIDGSQPATDLFPGAPITIRSFGLSGSTRIAYVAWDLDSFGGLYSVPVEGGSPLLLNPPALPDGGATSLVVRPDGQEIVYRAALGILDPDELYCVPADGSVAPVLLSSSPLSGDVWDDFTILPGERVAFIARQGSSLFADRFGLFGAPLDGAGPEIRYNDPIVSDTLLGDVTGFRATDDGALVVYRADQDADEVFDLYATHGNGLGIPRRLTAALPGAPLVLPEFVLTPGGERVLFQTSAAGAFALWSAHTATGVALQLDTATFELDLTALRTSPDAARVVYLRRVDAAGRLELRNVPSDGSAPAITLHPPLPAGHGVREFEVVPDGTLAVYRSGSSTLGIFELFRVPLDGSAPPVRLHAALTDARAVAQFRITPNGRRVVFRGDLGVNEVVELYSASLEGGAAPRKLSGPMVAGGDVTDFALSADGRTVVYRADQLADLRFDLFSVPVEGRNVRRLGEPSPGGATLLTALSGTRRVEPDFAFTPDGAQVVYRSNQDAAGDTELYRVPADGSAAPVKLSAPLVAGGDVRSFALAPDGSRVVYRADQRIVDIIELSSVPLAGGPAVVLDPLPSFADVSVYQIDPESARVLYLADRAVNGRTELFTVPLDASSAPVRVNRALPTGGLVEDDFLVRPGGRTLYRAEQEQDGALELYVDLDLADAVLPATRARRR